MFHSGVQIQTLEAGGPSQFTRLCALSLSHQYDEYSRNGCKPSTTCGRGQRTGCRKWGQAGVPRVEAELNPGFRGEAARPPAGSASGPCWGPGSLGRSRARGLEFRGWCCRPAFVNCAFSERTGFNHTEVLTLRRFLFAKQLVTTSAYRVGGWRCLL